MNQQSPGPSNDPSNPYGNSYPSSYNPKNLSGDSMEISIHKIFGKALRFLFSNIKDISIVMVPVGLLAGLFIATQFSMLGELFQNIENVDPESIESMQSSSNLGNIFSLLTYVLLAGLVRYYHFRNQGNTIDWSNPPWKELFQLRDILLILTAILWGLAYILGFILLLLPGIYIANLIFLGLVHSVEKDSFFIDSIKSTFRLAKGYWWKIAYFNFLMVFFALLWGLLYLLELGKMYMYPDFPPVLLYIASIAGYVIVFPLYVFAITEIHLRLDKLKNSGEN